jgi:hypothetical protein
MGSRFNYIAGLPLALVVLQHLVVLFCQGSLDPCVACANRLVDVCDAKGPLYVVGDLALLVLGGLHANNGFVDFVQLSPHRLGHGNPLVDSMFDHCRVGLGRWRLLFRELVSLLIHTAKDTYLAEEIGVSSALQGLKPSV